MWTERKVLALACQFEMGRYISLLLSMLHQGQKPIVLDVQNAGIEGLGHEKVTVCSSGKRVCTTNCELLIQIKKFLRSTICVRLRAVCIEFGFARFKFSLSDLNLACDASQFCTDEICNQALKAVNGQERPSSLLLEVRDPIPIGYF